METLALRGAGQVEHRAARVLVADDQPPVLDALNLLLKSHGYQTEGVTQPERVLQAVQSGEFDVVLLDMN